MAAALQEPFEQELGRGVQESLLAVWGANVLEWADQGGVFYLLESEESSLVLERRQNKFTRSPLANGHTSYEHHSYHEFRFDQEIFVSPNWNVFLHEAEVVKATQQQPTAVHP